MEKIVAKCEIGEGELSDDSEFEGGRDEELVENVDDEVQAEINNEPLDDASPTDDIDHSNPEFVADPDANEELVTEQNLSDVLGSEAISTITTSNSSAASTIRRATRKIVTPKSGSMVQKRTKRRKGDDGDNDDGVGLMEYMKMKMMHRMQSEEDIDTNRKLEARAEERRHELMLAQMKIDSERQRADAQRQNMLMMMMLGKVMGTTVNPDVIQDVPYNFSPEREGTDDELT